MDWDTDAGATVPRLQSAGCPLGARRALGGRARTEGNTRYKASSDRYGHGSDDNASRVITLNADEHDDDHDNDSGMFTKPLPSLNFYSYGYSARNTRRVSTGREGV